MDVGDWLRSLGLGQYETLFRQNDIDAEVLSELTEGDLEKFGVSFGHRKRLLKAIASLGSTETAAKPAAPVALQTSTDAAERRQLTVMFCDLVGSTAMSAAARSRGHAGNHRGLSQMLRGAHHAKWRICRPGSARSAWRARSGWRRHCAKICIGARNRRATARSAVRRIRTPRPGML